MLGYLIQESPTDYSTAKLQSLARDGYRCLITGHYDMTSYDKYSEIQQIVNKHGYALVATEAAHIFPPSTNAGITGNNEGGPKYEYAASVWAVIERFGGLLITDELNGADIHRLENIITMDVNLHRKFDRLAIWLEADSMNQHSYYVRGKDAAYTRGLPLMVTFTSTSPAFALPDPRYLRIHAACARVANLSGAGEYVDRIFRDMEDTRVLASNGSSGDTLSYALTHGSKIEVF